MRKKSRKSFKRFDLILRNQDKICIIDWKFSKIKANQKINTRAFVKKNELYLQLAKKEYKSDVELKFYCFHVDQIIEHYHQSTEADYIYRIAEVMIDEDPVEKQEDVSDSEVVFLEEIERREIMDRFFGMEEPQDTANNALERFKKANGLTDEKQHNKDVKTTKSHKTKNNGKTQERKRDHC